MNNDLNMSFIDDSIMNNFYTPKHLNTICVIYSMLFIGYLYVVFKVMIYSL